MTTRDKQIIEIAIINCENLEKQICADYIKLCPEYRQRIEANRDMFLLATKMVRKEIERLIEKEEQQSKA